MTNRIHVSHLTMTPEEFAGIQERIKTNARKVSPLGDRDRIQDEAEARQRNAKRLQDQRRGKPQAKSAAEPLEYQSQAALIQWWSTYCKTKGLDERLLVAVPNGSVLAGDAKARAIQMRRLKSTGFRVGYPDLILDLPMWDADRRTTLFHGLRIEMKRKGMKPSPEQASYHLLLRNMGYNVIVAFSFDEAQRAIEGYVG